MYLLRVLEPRYLSMRGRMSLGIRRLMTVVPLGLMVGSAYLPRLARLVWLRLSLTARWG